MPILRSARARPRSPSRRRRPSPNPTGARPGCSVRGDGRRRDVAGRRDSGRGAEARGPSAPAHAPTLAFAPAVLPESKMTIYPGVTERTRLATIKLRYRLAESIVGNTRSRNSSITRPMTRSRPCSALADTASGGLARRHRKVTLQLRVQLLTGADLEPTALGRRF